MTIVRGEGMSSRRGPLSVVEAVRTAPVHCPVVGRAKVVYVMEGRSRVETPMGPCEVTAGQTLVLGSRVWCAAWPAPSIRTWTVYADEEFLRSLMSWALPHTERVLSGLHPEGWDGRALLLDPDMAVLDRIEPLLRRMSVVADNEPAGMVASRLLSLFAQVVELVIPTLLVPDEQPRNHRWGMRVPVVEGLVQPPMRVEVAEAIRLLRKTMERRWTTKDLSDAVALSVSQLIRSFKVEDGTAPMRFLSEVRLTEFARLVEETELPIGVAARRVGWPDSRVAASWLRRRHGLAPSEYRRRRRPSCPPARASCLLCREPCWWRPAA